MQIAFLIFMFVLGAAFGSFLCCQVRRELGAFSRGIRSRYEDEARSPVKTGATSVPRKSAKLPSRSICLHCKKKLKWYDNIPIISWLILRGKCRFCHKRIGYAEIISELATAISMVMLGSTINIETATALEWGKFIAIILFSLTLIFLAIYDGISGKLPTICLIFALLFATFSIIPTLLSSFSIQPFLSAALFGGIYLILYLVSRGKWVGDGDWILSLAIGLALGHPWLSMIALFIANLSACLIMYPVVKKKKNHQIYFGPFLVLAFIVTYTFSNFFISMI